MIIESKIDITPAAAGYDPETLETLDRFFLDLVGKKRIQAAAYIMARHGKIFAHKAMGRLRYDRPDEPFQPDSLRKLASITKVYAATAALQLVERGVLYLEQPVADFIHEFDTTLHRAITVWHLLTHSSGLKADAGYFLEPYPLWRKIANTNDLIRFALEGPLQSSPGACWSYSTLGFAVLAEVISRAAGHTFEDTHFTVPDEKIARVCLVSEREEKAFAEVQQGRMLFKGGAGLTSTLKDQFIMGQMYLGRGTYDGVRILGRKTIEAMTRNQFDGRTRAFCWGLNIRSMEYGAGVSISLGGLMSRFVINHEGAGRCAWFADPAEDFMVMFMVPSDIQWAPETIENPRYIIWSGLR
jgi:CubicO group peptidase (beta-lactamase class C family)